VGRARVRDAHLGRDVLRVQSRVGDLPSERRARVRARSDPIQRADESWPPKRSDGRAEACSLGHRDASRTPIEVRAPDLVVPRASALDRIAREKETLVLFEQMQRQHA